MSKHNKHKNVPLTNQHPTSTEVPDYKTDVPIGQHPTDPGYKDRNWSKNGKFKPGNEVGKLGGRPSKFTPELGKEICERLVKGQTLTSICEDEHIPAYSNVYQWLGKEDEEFLGFQQEYHRARVMQVATWADMSLDATAAVLEERHSSARVSAHWNHSQRLFKLISCLNPEKYGDKTSVSHTGGVSIDIAVDRPPALTRDEWVKAHTKVIDVTPQKDKESGEG